MLFKALLLLSLFAAGSWSRPGVREVTNSSCDIIRVNLGLGHTTQIILEQEPKVTLFADQKHFRINTNPVSPRSLAIIPYVEPAELETFRSPNGRYPNTKALTAAVDGSFKTNLFVFFENNNQLMFELRFVEKEKADYILKVLQTFKKDCTL